MSVVRVAARRSLAEGLVMWGFVLAQVEVGREQDFFNSLGSIPQVRNVFYLFEDYEYLLEIEAGSPQELTKVMTNEIRHLPGVQRTATYIEGNTAAHPVLKRETSEVAGPLTLW